MSKRFKFMPEISPTHTCQGAFLLSMAIHHIAINNKSFTVTKCRLWNTNSDNIEIIGEDPSFRKEVKELIMRDL